MAAPLKSQPPLLPEPRRPIPSAPVHPMAALATVALDYLFFVFEMANPFIFIGIGVLGAITTTLVQRYLAKDGWGASVAKGMVMGIVAGVPYPVIGTFVGVPLLAWAGLHEWIKLPPKSKPALRAEEGEEEQEVVEAEVKEVK